MGLCPVETFPLPKTNLSHKTDCKCSHLRSLLVLFLLECLVPTTHESTCRGGGMTSRGYCKGNPSRNLILNGLFCIALKKIQSVLGREVPFPSKIFQENNLTNRKIKIKQDRFKTGFKIAVGTNLETGFLFL